MSVQIVATKKNIEAGKPSQLITMFDGKETGFIKLQSQSMDLSNPVWPRMRTRVATMKGTKEVLEYVIGEARKTAEKGVPSLPGRIQLREVLATEVPKDLRDLFFIKGQEEDEFIQQNAKKAGSQEDAPILTVDEVPILRFNVYDASGQKADETLAHDNVDEVNAHREATQNQEAALPGENL